MKITFNGILLTLTPENSRTGLKNVSDNEIIDLSI